MIVLGVGDGFGEVYVALCWLLAQGYECLVSLRQVLLAILSLHTVIQPYSTINITILYILSYYRLYDSPIITLQKSQPKHAP